LLTPLKTADFHVRLVAGRNNKITSSAYLKKTSKPAGNITKLQFLGTTAKSELG
jgi:glycerol-3-phosphate responsive antiterminator